MPFLTILRVIAITGVIAIALSFYDGCSALRYFWRLLYRFARLRFRCDSFQTALVRIWLGFISLLIGIHLLAHSQLYFGIGSDIPTVHAAERGEASW